MSISLIYYNLNLDLEIGIFGDINPNDIGL